MKHDVQSDPRHDPVRAQIIFAYRNANDGRNPPWSGRTGKLLKGLLDSLPSWPTQDLIWCVESRFTSEVNMAEDPLRWIRKLPDYLNGPLDRYGKPLVSRERPSVPEYRLVDEIAKNIVGYVWPYVEGPDDPTAKLIMEQVKGLKERVKELTEVSDR